MQKHELINGILIVLFVIMIATAGYAIYIMRTRGPACLANPLIYGVKEVESVNNAKFSCSCRISNFMGGKDLYLDSEGLKESADAFLIKP